MATFPFNQATEGQQQSQAGPSMVGPPSYGEPGVATPAVDVIDTTEEIWVFVDLPGFTEDETTVRADENTVIVSAERREEAVEGQNTLLRERPKKFERSLQLHAPVDTTDAEATYEHGVCRVKFPKLATERYTDIPFQ